MSGTDEDRPITRRRFLDKLLITGAGLTGLAFIGSFLAYVYPPPKRMGSGGVDKTEVGPVDEFPLGTGRPVVYGGNNVMVIRTESGFKGVDMKCTHLGCMVEWQPTRKVLFCPCHAAEFDQDGQVLRGPARRPLPLYRVEVKDGVAYVVGRV